MEQNNVTALADVKLVHTVENTFTDYPDVVSVEHLCKMLRMGKNRAYDLVKQKEIDSIKNDTAYIIPKISVINWLNEKLYKNQPKDLEIISDTCYTNNSEQRNKEDVVNE